MVAPMSNEPLGIFEELQERAKRYANQGEALRRRILAIGPARNGARAELVNPFRPRQREAPPPRVPFRIRYRDSSNRRRAIWPEARLELGIKIVMQTVCLASGLAMDDLVSVSRKRPYAWPRHVAMWAVDRYCPEYSLPEIGALFLRDHTTVMYGIDAVLVRLADHEPTTCELVTNVRERLTAIAIAQAGP